MPACTRLPHEPAVVAFRFVDWAADPFAGLGYSFVRPGGVGARALLAAPTGGVLFWAGEATNPARPATVHGAVESGIRAAEEVLSHGGRGGFGGRNVRVHTANTASHGDHGRQGSEFGVWRSEFGGVV